MKRKLFAFALLLVAVAAPFMASACSAMIVIDFGDPRTPGYWKNHAECWPIDSVTVGDVVLTKEEAIDYLASNSKDATFKLASQLIAAKFNAMSLFYGSYNPTTVWQAIGAADNYLATNPLGSNPQGETRDEALALKDALQVFNES